MEFKGVFPPIITVFRDDGEVDEAGLREHVDFIIENGAHGVIACGSTGEFPHLTVDERRRVAGIVVDHVNGRVPCLIGTAACGTKETIELSRHAEDIGADGLLIVPPYYFKPSEEELYEHYKAIASAVNLPIMLYNNPWTSGVDVKPPLLLKMAEDRVISYVKETHGDVARVHEITLLGGDKLTVFFGRDENAFEAFTVGAKGWVSGAGNVVIRLERELFDAMDKGDFVNGRRIYYKLLPFFLLTERRGRWIAYVKAGLEMMGRRAGKPRKPLLPLNEKDKLDLRKVLKDLNLIT